MINFNYPDLYNLDQELLAKVKGWIKAYHQSKTVYSNFLTLFQLNLVSKIFASDNIQYYIHQNFTNGLRKTISLHNEHSNIILLKAKLRNQEIKHNDILGFLLNQLKLKFDVVGDIYLTNNELYLTVIKKISGLLLSSPIVIKQDILTFTTYDQEITINYNFVYQNLIVSSLRLDNVISHICCLSRANGEKLIMAKKIFVNFIICMKKIYTINENDIISVTKYGRFQIISITILPKNKYKIVVGKFS